MILMRDIEERSTHEVADLLGITPNAVKIRTHRARRALRTILQGVYASADAAAAQHCVPA
jgi:DNA-directed RNA polymerase specialized sigma24 family protein